MKYITVSEKEWNEEVLKEAEKIGQRDIKESIDAMTDFLYDMIECNALMKYNKYENLTTEEMFVIIERNLNINLNKDKWRLILNSLMHYKSMRFPG